MNSQPNYSHKDLIQFWTSNGGGPSRNVTITGNRMDSPDGETHAIYMGNAEARSGNRASSTRTSSSRTTPSAPRTCTASASSTWTA